jgi:hypothetical protein
MGSLLIKEIVARLMHRYNHSISACFEHLGCEIYIDCPGCGNTPSRAQTAHACLQTVESQTDGSEYRINGMGERKGKCQALVNFAHQ